MPTNIEIYRNCMTEVRSRIDVVEAVINRHITTGSEIFNIELIYLQLRIALELIAFSSLSANKEAYASAHADFGNHWSARKMLDKMKKINPDFYPVALDPPLTSAPGIKHFPRPPDGFMTLDEFAILYDASSELIHQRNPFSTKSTTIQIVYSVQEWVVSAP